jgi:ABC transport system ATP-binding/permease protein
VGNQPEKTSPPFLLGQSGTLAGQRLALGSAATVIGRDPAQCQLVLAQAVVSRRHALIEVDAAGRAVITDLGSSQGTFVNGARIERQALRDGDRIGFGPDGVLAFTFHASAGAPPAAPPVPAAAPGLTSAETLRAQLLRAAQFSTAEHRAPTAPLPAPPVSPALRAPTAHVNAAHLSTLRIGRAPDNEIVLDSPAVSRYHAKLVWDGGAQPTLSDLGSTNGTFVNGELLAAPRVVAPADLIFVGGFVLRAAGREVKRHDLSASRITAWQITKDVPGRRLLNEISLALNPREFVGLMGPSGCGKSTLMDALNGLRPATSGAVYVNDLDLYRNFDALRRSIGYVPQRDILHDVLTVEQTLLYAARLRLPEATPEAERRRVVDEVIATVGLTEQRATPFKMLSGGQQKRLSLGLELVTKPSFLFLDEPTSPLDPETTENMMLLFRRLADEGRIVVMVTHKFEKFEEMHHVAILTKGGHLAFFGPPREALRYFGCREPGEIYRRIGERAPEEWGRAFQSSPQHGRWIAGRIAETRELFTPGGGVSAASNAAAGGVPGGAAPGAGRGFGLAQWLTLTARYLEIKLKDKRNTALLLAQAPVVALILAVIVGDTLSDAKTLFIAAIIAIWFGANNAVREIVAELPIYTRERLVNLKIPSYVCSKFAVLSGVALLQCLSFVAILVGFGRLAAGDFGWLTLILYLTSLGGVATGLFFSALVNSTEKAMSILPLVLIPQLLLSGFLKPLDDLYVNVAQGKPATAEEYRRFESAKSQPPSANPRAPRPMPNAPPEPVTKHDGLGAARYAAALMIARWSIEALAHQVSIEDRKVRDALATRMTVAEYEPPHAGQSESEIESAYRGRVLLDLAVLAGFSVLFLALTMWALKRKDVL